MDCFTSNGSHRSTLICVYVFRLRLCLYLNVQQTQWCFRSQVRNVCRFPEHSKLDGGSVVTSRLVLAIGFVVLGWVCWALSLCPATSEPNSFIQVSSKEIFGGGQRDSYNISQMMSTVSI